MPEPIVSETNMPDGAIQAETGCKHAMDASGETPDITVLILTLNEERHIIRCLESVRGLARRVVVVDSGSTDQTQSIAKNMGAEVYVHGFVNYATQMNWGIDNSDIKTAWIMRLDADEVVTPKLRAYLQKHLSALSEEVAGITINRQVHFMGKWIKHGGMYPIRMLRIWRLGQGRCESRWMDEHITVRGAITHINADIADINLNRITWWTSKHNAYASREAIDILLSNSQARSHDESRYTISLNARLKRFIKYHIYARMPIGLRAAAYFFYRYFLLLGFLDGWPGFALHFLQGFWYRFLVDVKVYELRQLMANSGGTLEEVVRAEYGFDLRSGEDK
jgi:glycosyltransferase involved in cell wall biosynthesis